MTIAINTQIKLYDNKIYIPLQIVKDENLEVKQRYSIEFKETSIELIKSEKLSNTWRFWQAGKNAGFKLVLKPESIPENMKPIFDGKEREGTKCLYEITNEKIVIHF